jgi:hypothetical protein
MLEIEPVQHLWYKVRIVITKRNRPPSKPMGVAPRITVHLNLQLELDGKEITGRLVEEETIGASSD